MGRRGHGREAHHGYDEREGWRHGVAHGADLLLQLSMDKRVDGAAVGWLPPRQQPDDREDLRRPEHEHPSRLLCEPAFEFRVDLGNLRIRL